MNIILPTKKVVYQYHGEKVVNIPKFGLAQYKMIEGLTNSEVALSKLVESIKKNPTKAERDLITLHILEYNGKMDGQVEVDGHTYYLNDVYIDQKLKYQIGEYEFKFKSPNIDQCSLTIDIMLRECCTSAKKSNEPIEVPDFLDMPAYVLNWADRILNTLALDTPYGTVRGLSPIMELFNAKLEG